MYLYYENFIHCILKTIFLFFIAYLLSSIFMFNHELGISIADTMQIPYDLTLTVFSLGFVNNITVVFTVLDLIFIGIIINHLNKYKTIHKLFKHFSNFMDF